MAPNQPAFGDDSPFHHLRLAGLARCEVAIIKLLNAREQLNMAEACETPSNRDCQQSAV